MEENIESLIPLFKNEQFAFNFAIQNHLLYQCLYCDRCNSKMYIVTDNSKKFVLNGFVLIAKERKVYCMEAYFMELNYQSQKYFI